MDNNETWKHHETILCPECDSKEQATVEHTRPWWTYLHTCKNCDYQIMESDWDRTD